MNATSSQSGRDGTSLQDRAIPLTSAQIHLWLAFYAEVIDEPLRREYWQLLTAAEQEQQRRFYFARDQQRYLVTRALVRTVLSRYVPVAPKDWVFSPNTYGRPEIVNEQGRDAGLSFNISHTHDLIVLGVTRHRTLGVDVENVTAREVSLDIADRFFSPSEVTALRAVPAQQQQFRFFEYWTFKESYIKARGMGLSLPLDKFSFHYAHERAVDITIHPELADDATRWQFWQFRPAPEYLVATCAERIGARSPSFTVRQTIPLVSETVLAPEFLRTSDESACIERGMM